MPIFWQNFYVQFFLSKTKNLFKKQWERKSMGKTLLN